MASSIETTSTTTTFKNQNTTYITVDTNNNIGIGTTTPAVNLNVAKSADGVAARFQRTSGGGLVDIETYNGIGGIGTGDNIPFRINTNSTERVRIDTSGNVGIGTNAPAKKLHIRGGTDAIARVDAQNDAAANPELQLTAVARQFNVGVGGATFGTAALRGSYYLYDNTATAYRFVIDNTGNVGINKTAPVTKLHIEGGGTSLPATTGTTPSAGTTLRIRPGNNAILDIGGNSTSGAWLQSYDQTGMQTEYPLLLNPNGGNVGIGTTGPQAKLDIRDDIAESSAYTGQLAINSVTKSTGNLARMMFSHDDHGSASIASDYESAGYGNLIFSTRGGGNPTERMRITGAGDLKFNSGFGSTGTAYGCRAWVNFNGQGTLAIRGSANVSSVTDVAVGNYRVNFTNNMPDVNYCSAGTAGGAGADQINVSQNSQTEVPAVGSCRYTVAYQNGSAWDANNICICIFR